MKLIKKQTIFIIILGAILLIVAKIYYDLWKERKEVKEFIEQNNIISNIQPHKQKKNINQDTKPQTKISPKIKKKQNIKLVKVNETEVKFKNYILKNRLPKTKFEVGYKIIIKPRFVATHRSSDKYIFLQDENNYLYFLTNKCKLIWKKPLKEKIITKFYEVDFYKNKKIQYLFATKNYIYIIDYNGNRVNYYPKDFKNIGHCSLIDYAKNNNYRILITKKNTSKIFLKDKYFKNLQNWSPLTLKNNFIIRPFHIRVQNKDLFICIEKKGIIEIITRKGEQSNGFPLLIKNGIKKFILIQKKTLKDTNLVILSNDDTVYIYDLEGNLKDSKDLKTHLSIDGEISIHIDKYKRQDYIFSVTKHYTKTLYNSKFLKLSSITTPPYKNFLFYFKIRDKHYFFTRDISNSKLLLYDQEGKIISDPINCALAPKIYYSKQIKSFILSIAKNDEVQIHNLKI